MREWELHLGDALGVLPGMPDGSADAVVCDPPAGIGFMGKTWDRPKGYGFKDGSNRIGEMPAEPRSRMSRNQVCRSCRKMKRGAKKCRCECPDFDTDRDGRMQTRWCRDARRDFLAFLTPIMAECLRVLKPGGYALVWALPRTSHWTATALEDAGFEIRDVITHLFGQGFPKGKGCLKPASEHWVLCRRPGPRVLPLNIDECRVESPLLPSDGRAVAGNGKVGAGGVYNTGWDADAYGGPEEPHPGSARHDARGRWPANLVLSHHPECVCRGTKRVKSAGWRDEDGQRGRRNGTAYNCSRDGSLRESASVHHAGPDGTEEVEDWACHPECAVRLLDEQAGERRPGERPARATSRPGANGTMGGGWSGGNLTGERVVLDSGNVSRFFYVSKADRADRGEGNDHATVKPTALMSWLVKLVSRPGETVLDPFMGSGSTGVAALRCERRFVGIEKDAHYHSIALRRLAAVDGPLFARPAGEDAP